MLTSCQNIKLCTRNLPGNPYAGLITGKTHSHTKLTAMMLNIMGFWLRRVHTKQDYIDIVERLLCMRDLPGNPIMQQTFYLFKREMRSTL